MTHKLLVLDMDGVINSNILIRKWIENSVSTLKLKYPDYSENQIHEQSVDDYKKEFCNCRELVFPELAEKITTIVNNTSCKILWSSTWRLLDSYTTMESIKEMFNRRGLPGDAVIGCTPNLSYQRGIRGDEIRIWLLNNTFGTFDKVAVLDDVKYAGIGIPNYAKFFQTNENIGITDVIMNDIISYLNS